MHGKKFRKRLYLVLPVIAIAASFLYFWMFRPQTVLNNIPAGMDFCLSIHKDQLIKNIFTGDQYHEDPMLKKLKTKLSPEVFSALRLAGFNPLGDLAIFGKNETFALSWVGKHKLPDPDSVKSHHWKSGKASGYTLYILDKNLYLACNNYLYTLCNRTGPLLDQFYQTHGKKILKKHLEHPMTKNSLVFGYLTGTGLIKRVPGVTWGKMSYVGMDHSDSMIRLFVVQPGKTFPGPTGRPAQRPEVSACISWPVTLNDILGIKYIPDTVGQHIRNLVQKPVNHLVAEILDTTSTNERIVTYLMNDEFELTQKIIYSYKTFPGLNLVFRKVQQDGDTSEKPTNLGMPILKLTFREEAARYVVQSENRQVQAYPHHYAFLNFGLLKTDPFWKDLFHTGYKSAEVYTENRKDGSVIYFEVKK